LGRYAHLITRNTVDRCSKRVENYQREITTAMCVTASWRVELA